MNRGAAGTKVFTAPDDCRIFLDALGDAASKYAMEVHAYCLLPNHYHLLVRSKEGQLSDFMRFLVGRFTRLKNRHEGRDGPIFRGRFTSRLIESDPHLLEVLRYIHLNPVKANLSPSAEAWTWSSARAYLGLTQRSDWLITRQMLEMFGPSEPRERYRAFMSDGTLGGVRPGGSDTV